ncbi:hypothetical protein [Nocardia sp. R6R-6]|uniref:hypothetical protein n=1 Tax=Nocardia sp. R6R-6 TaxID=3459303 RepID=UPI00403D69D7
MSHHRITLEDFMGHVMPKIIAAVAISLTLGWRPVIAVAAPDATSPEPAPATRTETTAPFDPVCPFCFLRELIESGSSRR